jgi:hypothetical protein
MTRGKLSRAKFEKTCLTEYSRRAATHFCNESLLAKLAFLQKGEVYGAEESLKLPVKLPVKIRDLYVKRNRRLSLITSEKS